MSRLVCTLEPRGGWWIGVRVLISRNIGKGSHRPFKSAYQGMPNNEQLSLLRIYMEIYVFGEVYTKGSALTQESFLTK